MHAPFHKIAKIEWKDNDKPIIKFKDLKVALSVIPNTCKEKSVELMPKLIWPDWRF